MTRSLENLFDEPQRSSKTKSSAPAGGDFDALLDEEKIETKGAIDPSWDKVNGEKQIQATEGSLQTPSSPAADSALDDDGLDDLMGMTAARTPSRPSNGRTNFPPEPALSSAMGRQDDGQASFPWWVIVAAILLILAGAAAVVTIS